MWRHQYSDKDLQKGQFSFEIVDNSPENTPTSSSANVPVSIQCTLLNIFFKGNKEQNGVESREPGRDGGLVQNSSSFWQNVARTKCKHVLLWTSIEFNELQELHETLLTRLSVYSLKRDTALESADISSAAQIQVIFTYIGWHSHQCEAKDSSSQFYVGRISQHQVSRECASCHSFHCQEMQKNQN